LYLAISKQLIHLLLEFPDQKFRHFDEIFAGAAVRASMPCTWRYVHHPIGANVHALQFYTQEREGIHVPWNNGTLLPVKDANGVVRPSLTPFLFNTEIKNVEASAMATSTTPITLTFTPPLDQLPHSAGPLAPVPNHSRPTPTAKKPETKLIPSTHFPRPAPIVKKPETKPNPSSPASRPMVFPAENAQRILTGLRDQVRQHYQSYEVDNTYVLVCHRYLFASRTLNQRLSLSYDYTTCWLCSVEEARLQMVLYEDSQRASAARFFGTPPTPTPFQDTVGSYVFHAGSWSDSSTTINYAFSELSAAPSDSKDDSLQGLSG